MQINSQEQVRKKKRDLSCPGTLIHWQILPDFPAILWKHLTCCSLVYLLFLKCTTSALLLKSALNNSKGKPQLPDYWQTFWWYLKLHLILRTRCKTLLYYYFKNMLHLLVCMDQLQTLFCIQFQLLVLIYNTNID